MSEKEPSPIWHNYINEKEWEHLCKSGAVGHVVANFIDRDGKIVDVDINKRVIGTDFHIIDNIPYMIAVAGTLQKADAILATLRGRHFTVLITDDVAARTVLEKKRSLS